MSIGVNPGLPDRVGVGGVLPRTLWFIALGNQTASQVCAVGINEYWHGYSVDFHQPKNIATPHSEHLFVIVFAVLYTSLLYNRLLLCHLAFRILHRERCTLLCGSSYTLLSQFVILLHQTPDSRNDALLSQFLLQKTPDSCSKTVAQRAYYSAVQLAAAAPHAWVPVALLEED